jgi:5-formaminoimidazole-4-carboxamide-1-beta-D-ribofuranosyl 5'-monophosphate synthetase
MRKWSNKFKRVIKEQKAARGKSINLAIVTANNHYAGFGPENANIFRKMVGLPSLNWEEEKKKYDKLVQTDNVNIPRAKVTF